MIAIVYRIFLVALFFANSECKHSTGEFWMTISIPDPRPVTGNLVLNTIKEVDCDLCYITRIKPSPNLNVGHHTVLGGCTEVNKTADQCSSQISLLYGWSYHMYELHLPEGNGYKVGRNTLKKYVQLQVHYMGPLNLTDDQAKKIWVKIYWINEELIPVQSIWSVSLEGVIPPKKITPFDISCIIPKGNHLEIIAYGVFAHKIATDIMGYVVKGCDKKCNWTLVGHVDPRVRENHKFFPVQPPINAKHDNRLASRCVFDNTYDHSIKIGYPQEDEMCIFIYLVTNREDHANFLRECGKPGPPKYSWSKDKNLNNIPPNP